MLDKLSGGFSRAEAWRSSWNFIEEKWLEAFRAANGRERMVCLENEYVGKSPFENNSSAPMRTKR